MNPIADFRDKLNELLADARLKEAFDLLLKILKPGTKFHTEVSLLKGRYEANERDYRNGTKKMEAHSTESAKIRQAFLQILNDYFDEESTDPGSNSKTPRPWKRFLPILFLTGGFFLGALFNYIRLDPVPENTCQEEEKTIDSLSQKINNYRDSLKNKQPLVVNKGEWENDPKTIGLRKQEEDLKKEKDDLKRKYDSAERERIGLVEALGNCKASKIPKLPNYSRYTLYYYNELDTCVEKALKDICINLEHRQGGTGPKEIIRYYANDQEVAKYLENLITKCTHARPTLKTDNSPEEQYKIYYNN